jgi:glutamine synthetase
MNPNNGQLFKFYKSISHLDQKGSVIAEYVWIDGTGITLRSKARTITNPIRSIADIPEWNYDGSSCWQASTHNSEVLLKPVFYTRDPFREGENIIVLCESWVWADENFTTKKPANTNFRHYAEKIFNAQPVKDQEPWFGIE